MRLLPLIAAPLALVACAGSATPEAQDGASPGGEGTLFVANKRGASLSRIDLATGEESHRAQTCENPHELTVSPDDQYVMVACYSGRTLEVYATSDLSEVHEITLGAGARVHSALWRNGHIAIAGAEGRGTLYQILLPPVTEDRTPDAGLIEIGEVSGGPGPHLVAVDDGDDFAWGTIIPTGEVVRYDLRTRTEVQRRRIGEQIEAIALSPDGESLWVASNADAIAYRLNPETLEIVAEVATGEIPIRLAMHPSGQFVVSSNFGSGDLSVIDTGSNEVVRTIPVSGSQEAVQVTLVFSEDGSRLYAAETATDTIAEVDFASGEVLRRIATGPGGDGLAVID